jgi:hypothetical protein
LKLDAWTKKKCSDLHRSQPVQANCCRSMKNSDHSCSKRTNGFERILAHRIGCQRAVLPVQQKGLRITANNLTRVREQFQSVNTHFVISTRILKAHISHAIGGVYSD